MSNSPAYFKPKQKLRIKFICHVELVSSLRNLTFVKLRTIMDQVALPGFYDLDGFGIFKSDWIRLSFRI